LFLDEMNAIVSWSRLLALVEPHHPQAGNGRCPVGLEIMLRVYFVQQRFNLLDPGVEDALYDSPALRRFVGVDLRSTDKRPVREGHGVEPATTG
jgi:IS5 family transposase